MKKFTKPLAVAAGISALIVVTSAGTAVAGSLITSHDIKDGTIHAVDIKDGGVHHRNLGMRLQSKIDKDATIHSYVNNVQVQIPAGQKAEGSAMCHEGDLAVGGGYSSNDNTNGWAKVYQNRMTWSQAAQDAAVANGGDGDDQPDGWYAQALGGDVDSDMYVWVTCLAS